MYSKIIYKRTFKTKSLQEERENHFERVFSSVDEVPVEEEGVSRRRLPNKLEDLQEIEELAVNITDDDERVRVGKSNALQSVFFSEDRGNTVDDLKYCL